MHYYSHTERAHFNFSIMIVKRMMQIFSLIGQTIWSGCAGVGDLSSKNKPDVED